MVKSNAGCAKSIHLLSSWASASKMSLYYEVALIFGFFMIAIFYDRYVADKANSFQMLIKVPCATAEVSIFMIPLNV
ncbi:hypothetical protein [Xylella fastidiosa]|nr:hypothetical protein [Xylella fastidiosa]